ncbi:MAG TPA: NAD(P)/FAD-dependent oxidoreductase [Polyangiaceae bacterium]|nr:NAD(P)/FAD-dependent oxidoreductase [Polyangiaceae bacterium]
MAEPVDAVVIGAGVVGLAIARTLALASRDVLVVEAESAMGTHTSSRNSEVIHAGIYYPTGSLKASLCVTGKAALYAYCAEHEVEHVRIGKVIVATREQEIPVLDRLLTQARENGVHDLVPLSADEVHELEPKVVAVRGLLSPSTGIIDSHGLMAALRREAEAHGAQVVTQSPVVAGRVTDQGIELEIGGPEPISVLAKSVINSAGLRAQEVSRSILGLPRESIPPQHFAKGHYFVLPGKSPFSRLVYPVPVPGGLGIHVTLDLARQTRFGPDVSWLSGVDYAFDAGRAEQFYAAIRTYYPDLREGTLEPGYTGIRPKLGPKGSEAADFMIQGPAEHGVPGLVALYGIESPGLTACLAIAERVSALLQ